MKRALESSTAPAAAAVDPLECSTEWSSACVCVSGSVAAVKAPELVSALLQRGVSVDLVITTAAFTLLKADYRGSCPWTKLEALAASTGAAADTNLSDATEAAPRRQPALHIWRDADEWSNYNSVGSDPVLHIELAKRNRLLLIAPLCANTLAAAALGHCSNLLTSVLRAWYYDLDPAFSDPIAERYGAHVVSRPVLVAPAMNTFMWHQRVTAAHVATLEARGVILVPPIKKKLACGDTGMGAMAEVGDVVNVAYALLADYRHAEAAAERDGKPRFVP